MDTASSTKPPKLILEGLTKRFGKARAVHEVSLQVEEGEFLTLLGPSGSGKTTTLSIIAGFENPTAGCVIIDGENVTKVPPNKRNLGVVFQHYALFPNMTVYDNVAYPLKQRKRTKAQIRTSVGEALELVRMGDFAERRPAELSGGQQQRVAVARALVFKPSLLLMDEPLGALDKNLREWLQLELRRIHRELGSTFVYVTHDQDEALTLSDRIAIFQDGEIAQIGAPQTLYSRPRSRFVGEFLGESTIFEGKVVGTNGARAFECSDGRFAFGAGEVPNSECLMVRPENFLLGPPADSCDNLVRGVVREAVYLGSAYRYEVRLNSGNVCVTRPPVSVDGLHIGDEVQVGWNADDSILTAGASQP